MADKDDKDNSYGGSQGNRGGTSSDTSNGGRNDSGSSGRGGVGSTGSGGGNTNSGGGGGNSAGSSRNDSGSSGRGGVGSTGSGNSGGGNTNSGSAGGGSGGGGNNNNNGGGGNNNNNNAPGNSYAGQDRAPSTTSNRSGGTGYGWPSGGNTPSITGNINTARTDTASAGRPVGSNLTSGRTVTSTPTGNVNAARADTASAGRPVGSNLSNPTPNNINTARSDTASFANPVASNLGATLASQMVSARVSNTPPTGYDPNAVGQTIRSTLNGPVSYNPQTGLISDQQLPNSFDLGKLGTNPNINPNRFAPELPTASTGMATGITSFTPPTSYTPGRFGMAVPPASGSTMYDKLQGLDEAMSDPMGRSMPQDFRPELQQRTWEEEQAPGYTDRGYAPPADPSGRFAPSVPTAPSDGYNLSGPTDFRAPGTYNPSTGVPGASINARQFDVPGTSYAGTETAPKGLGTSYAGTETAGPRGLGTGLGMSMAGTETAPSVPGTSYAGTETAPPTTTDLPSGTRAGELQSMDKMAHYSLREAIKPSESGTSDPYGRMVEGGPVDYNKGLYDGSMTLDDVREMQKGMLAKGYNSTAVGAYQVIDTTLDMAAARLGLPGSTVMTESVWDSIGDALIDNRVEKAKAMTGGLTPENLGHQLANEWAAFTSPKTGKGVHDKVGTNRATVSADQVRTFASDFINNHYNSPTTTVTAGTGTGTGTLGDLPPGTYDGYDPATADNPHDPSLDAAPGTPAQPGAPAAAGGTVTTTPPGTFGFPATPPAQPQAPGFPSFKTPATGYKRSGLGTVLGIGIDAIAAVAGGPISLAAQGGAYMLTGDTIGGTVADMVGGKYGPNQYTPGRDDRYSGDRGTVGSGGGQYRGVNNPITTSQTPAVKPGEEEKSSYDISADAFIGKYLDPSPNDYPTPFEKWGKDFGWVK